MPKKRWFYLAVFLVLALALIGPPLYTHFYGDVSNDAGDTSTLKDEQNSPSSGGGEIPESETPDGYEVFVAVVGKEGELLFGPSMVTLKEDSRWGLTAMGALQATGLSFTTHPNYGDFVTSVEGLKNEGSGGWMYKVNDEIPSVSAGEITLERGDKVIWWYSSGSDFEGPSWDSLVP
ncbi:MAG: DUF4430 domain-containing protein [Clostridia bacterium]|nr:DUF4430 domain-containing protein [Clostridia bacterium]